MSEKFSLKWNDYQSNWTNSLSVLRNDNESADVTLISDDKVKFTAHKIILKSCSNVLKFILQGNSHSNPLLFLSGLSSVNIRFILDYMYYGEVNLFQEQLDSFLNSAQKLEIEGLLSFDLNCQEEKEKNVFLVRKRKIQPCEKIDEEPSEYKGLKRIEGNSNIKQRNYRGSSNNVKKENNEEENGRELREYWIEDLNAVEWYFLKTGKSGKSQTPGVLITNSESYKYQSSGANNKNTRHTFTCSEKPRTGCNAVARLFRRDILGEEGEQDKVEWELYQLSSEESHARFHTPVRPRIIADRIMARMTGLMREDPSQDPLTLRDKVLLEDLHTLPEDEQRQVEKYLPKRPESTLSNLSRAPKGNR